MMRSEDLSRIIAISASLIVFESREFVASVVNVTGRLMYAIKVCRGLKNLHTDGRP